MLKMGADVFRQQANTWRRLAQVQLAAAKHLDPPGPPTDWFRNNSSWRHSWLQMSGASPRQIVQTAVHENFDHNSGSALHQSMSPSESHLSLSFFEASAWRQFEVPLPTVMTFAACMRTDNRLLVVFSKAVQEPQASSDGSDGVWAQLHWHLVNLANGGVERYTPHYTWPCTWGMKQLCHAGTSRALGFVSLSNLAVIDTNSMRETGRCCFSPAMVPRARANSSDAQPLRWSDDGSMILICVERPLPHDTTQSQRLTSPWAIQLHDAATGSMLMNFPMPQIPGGR